MNKCAISSQLNSYLNDLDEAESLQEAQQAWVIEKSEEAFSIFVSEGECFLGQFAHWKVRKGLRQKIIHKPFEFAFEEFPEQVDSIIETAVQLMLKGQLIEAVEELEKVKEFIMKTLIKFYSDRVEGAGIK